MVDWADLRCKQFPGASEHASYLNSAVSGLMSRSAAAAIAAAAQEWCGDGAAAVMDPSAQLQSVRAGLARLLHCSMAEIALTGNASDSLNTAAAMLDTDAVALEDEFSSATVAWLHRGKDVHFTTAADVLACGGDILSALDRKLAENPSARALLVSCVSYMDGHTIDIHRAGQICRRRQCDLVVDATQALGAMPIDLTDSGVSFLCAAGYKWMCAGPGLGVLYTSSSILQRYPKAPFAGWFSQAIDGHNDKLHPHTDARRFHYGTPNLLVLAAFSAALRLLESEMGGVEAVAARLAALSGHLRRALTSAGFELIGAFGEQMDPATASHITCVAVAQPQVVAAALASRGIHVTAKDRHGVTGLRVAPHVYNTLDEITLFVAALSQECAPLGAAAATAAARTAASKL